MLKTLMMALLLASCASPYKQVNLGEVKINLDARGIPFNFTPQEVTESCDKALKQVNAQVDALAAGSDKTTDPIQRFEDIMANMDAVLTPYIFVNSVHTDEKVREASLNCQKNVSEFYINVFTNKGLYKVIKSARVASNEEKRLKEKMVLDFEENGLKLSDKKLKKVKELLKEISKLSTDFSNNIKEDKSKLYFTKSDLDGLPDTVLEQYKKDEKGKYIVTTSYPDIIGVLKYAKKSSVRKQVFVMRNTRAPQNKQVLNKVIELRRKVAGLFGYKNWADYRTANGRMAKNSKEIWSFIDNLRKKLREGSRKDIAKLARLKKELKLGDDPVQLWDISYLSELYKKTKFNLDSEQVKEYFPSKYVVARMFDVYSKLLGVTFKEVGGAPVWHDTVSLYKVIDKKSGDEVAYFYTDFIPREGKYSHAAAFTLRPGRRLADGSYVKPISAIVANFTPGTDSRPSLLSHGEVETLFHEFGHIMHQVLTRAPYAYLSGTSVERDFVEAPSQMLEEWVWFPEIVNVLSGHYTDTSKKLPADMLKKLLEMKRFNLAYGNTRQLFYGTVDMTLHSKRPQADLSRVSRDLSWEISGLRMPDNTHFETSFGHLMGYSAGYYGYLWSKVYAIDMFSLFEKQGLMNEDIGMRYRKEILEPGGMRDASEHLKAFLKRGPRQEPFYRWLGL